MNGKIKIHERKKDGTDYQKLVEIHTFSLSPQEGRPILSSRRRGHEL